VLFSFQTTRQKTKKQNIMKTRSNINPISISIAAVAIFLMSALTPVKASGNDSMAYYYSEYQAAIDRLDNLNMSIEESVIFTAPSVAEDVVAYEIESAGERLENLNVTVEEAIRYQAPVINEEAEAQDVAAAIERLENLNLAIERSIQF
jgi:hypothetical protein